MKKPAVSVRFDPEDGYDISLERVRQAGDRLMAVSGLRYQGRWLGIGAQSDVHVMEFGSGEPLILIHGAGGGGAVWHRQIAALNQHFRVIVPDLPMFGLSGMPRQLTSIRVDISRLILDLMDSFDIDCANIMGHSLGGLSVIGAVTSHPERFGKIALVASAGLGFEIPWMYKAASIPVVGEIMTVPNRSSHNYLFEHYESHAVPDTDEVSAHKLYQFQVLRRKGRYRHLLRGLRLFSNIRGQRDLVTEAELNSVPNPTLVVWGSHDRYFPVSHYKRLVTQIPRSEGVVLQDCGHLPGIDAPERYTDLLLEWFTSS